MASPVATMGIPAPAFFVDVASVMAEGIFIVGTSILGGPDVLGDPGSDELAHVYVIGESFPPLTRLIIVNLGITRVPATGRVTAISGEVFAFVAGGRALIRCVTRQHHEFDIAVVYNGRTNVLVS